MPKLPSDAAQQPGVGVRERDRPPVGQRHLDRLVDLVRVQDDPRHEPKVRQGVTTEGVGVDGNSFAPFPNRGEYLTQGPDCRSSFGHDAIRHLLIYQKI